MSTFRWLNKQGVESTAGFVLQRKERYFYHYIEGDRILKVDVEPRGTTIENYSEEIVTRSLDAWLKPAGESLSQADRVRIRANIEAALQFKGIAYEFSKE